MKSLQTMFECLSISMQHINDFKASLKNEITLNYDFKNDRQGLFKELTNAQININYIKDNWQPSYKTISTINIFEFLLQDVKNYIETLSKIKDLGIFTDCPKDSIQQKNFTNYLMCRCNHMYIILDELFQYFCQIND